MARDEAGLLQTKIDGKQQRKCDELRGQRPCQAGSNVGDPDGKEHDVTADKEIERHLFAGIQLRRPVYAGKEAKDGHAVVARQLVQIAERLDCRDTEGRQQGAGQERSHAGQRERGVDSLIAHSSVD